MACRTGKGRQAQVRQGRWPGLGAHLGRTVVPQEMETLVRLQASHLPPLTPPSWPWGPGLPSPPSGSKVVGIREPSKL